jgi:hypothetical protein
MPRKISELDTTLLKDLGVRVARLEKLRLELPGILQDAFDAKSDADALLKDGQRLQKDRDDLKPEADKLEPSKKNKLDLESKRDDVGREHGQATLKRKRKQDKHEETRRQREDAEEALKKARLAALERRLRDLKQAGDQKEQRRSELVGLQERMHQLQQRVNRLRSKLLDPLKTASEREKIQREIEDLESELLPLLNDARATQRALVEVVGDLDFIDRERVRLNRLLAPARTTLPRRPDELETDGDVKDAWGRLDDLDRKIAKQQKALTDLDAQVDLLAQQHGKLQEEIARAEKEVEVLLKAHDQWKALVAKVKALVGPYQGLRQTAKDLETKATQATDDLKREEIDAVAAFDAASRVAGDKLSELDVGTTNFHVGIAKVPGAFTGRLAQLDADVSTAQAKRTTLGVPAALHLAAGARDLEDVFTGCARLVDEFNNLVTEVKGALKAERLQFRAALNAPAKLRCDTAGLTFMTACWVNDDRTKGAGIRDFIGTECDAQGDACLTNPGGTTNLILARVDDLIRRCLIRRLFDRYKNMCFGQRLAAMATNHLTNGSTVVVFQAAIDQARLNPNLSEWRRCLGVPSGGGWEMRGAAAHNGIKIHVTVSYNSIQLPANAPLTYPNAAALREALFDLPNSNLQVHGTFEKGTSPYPHIYWDGSGGAHYNWNRVPMVDRPDAQTAVTNALNIYKNALRNDCQAAIDHLNAGRDILGNTPA